MWSLCHYGDKRRRQIRLGEYGLCGGDDYAFWIAIYDKFASICRRARLRALILRSLDRSFSPRGRAGRCIWRPRWRRSSSICDRGKVRPNFAARASFNRVEHLR